MKTVNIAMGPVAVKRLAARSKPANVTDMQARSQKWMLSALSGMIVAGLLAAGTTAATPSDFLVRNDYICDAERIMCIRGTLVFLPDSRIMQLNGRVAGSPGPGWVRILFQGEWRGHLASTVMEFPIRGANSEIIDYKYIPDNPAVRYWRVLNIAFEPDEEAARAARSR